MKNSTIRIVVVLGIFAIAGIIVVQAYWMLRAWDLKEKQLDQSIQIVLKNVAERLAERKGSKPPVNTVKQISSDYYLVNLNDEIDANWLEYYLKTEFNELKLSLDFEYGIYDCNTDEMMYGNYIKSGNTTEKIKRSKNLPKYSKLPYYFSIHFPTRNTYLASSVQLWIFFSVILFIAVVFFSYSLLLILQQKRLSELQKDFINNMTHEFKTPISTIQIASGVLQESAEVMGNLRLKQYVKTISEQNERLNGQVEKVLQIARIEKNGIKLQKEKLSLHDIIQQVVSSVNVKTNGEDSIELQLNAQNNSIFADKVHLTNILYNLLDNAAKYCQTTPHIVINTTDQGKGICLSIADNGIGIDSKYQKQIFNRFFRVPTGNLHDVKGFGLGLFYVKEICRTHGWKIKVQSELNKGSTFSIYIK